MPVFTQVLPPIHVSRGSQAVGQAGSGIGRRETVIRPKSALKAGNVTVTVRVTVGVRRRQMRHFSYEGKVMCLK